MHRRSLGILGALLAVALAAPAAAAPPGPDIFPLARVKKGQKGFGLTVFEGTKPERFEFEVIGVARNFLPRMDLIIVKSDDPKIQQVGLARGMSGSPLYLEGKVACAYSYGWAFSKINFGLCTPIEYMVAELDRPARGPEKTALASAEEWQRYVPLEALADRGGERSRPTDSWLLRAPLPTPPPLPRTDDGQVVRAGLPLAISGLGATAFEQARKIFAPFDIEPMQGGGGGDPTRGPRRFEMGGAIGGELARGDVSMVATGTVSYIAGDRLLAFGHPFTQFGEAYIPTTTAEVHLVVPSIYTSWKFATPLRTLGSIVQDRQAGIVVDTRKTTEMIPVVVNVRSPTREESFKVEVLRHRFLTPALVGMIATNAAQTLVPDVADVTVMIESRLAVRGFAPLVFTDYRYSPDGAGSAIASARALRVLLPLLFNPFAPVHLDRVDIDVTVAFKADYVSIEALRVPDLELPAGKQTHIDVVMRPYAGQEYVERIPLTIPERLAGATVKIEVVPGDQARPDVAPPESLRDVVEALRKTYPANTLVATVYTPDEGVTLGGKVIPNLPDSALDTARPATSSRRADAYKSVDRAVVPSRRVVEGKQEIIVKIRDDK